MDRRQNFDPSSVSWGSRRGVATIGGAVLQSERRGGALYEIPNGKEVDLTTTGGMKFWALAVQVALLAAYAGRSIISLPRVF